MSPVVLSLHAPHFSISRAVASKRRDNLEAVLTGRDPLMAPGILAIAAAVAVAATYASVSTRSATGFAPE